MACDDPADLIASCEATLDVIALLLYKLRRRHVRLLRSLKPAEWRRSGTLSPLGKVTIAGIVRHVAAHDAAHTAQIARRLSGRPG